MPRLTSQFKTSPCLHKKFMLGFPNQGILKMWTLFPGILSDFRSLEDNRSRVKNANNVFCEEEKGIWKWDTAFSYWLADGSLEFWIHNYTNTYMCTLFWYLYRSKFFFLKNQIVAISIFKLDSEVLEDRLIWKTPTVASYIWTSMVSHWPAWKGTVQL